MSNEPLDLEHFDLDTAWLIGTTLATKCREQRLPVTISIQLGMQRVFHAALPGTSADNDSWVDRKSQVVRRFGCSSQEVHSRYVGDDADKFFTTLPCHPRSTHPGVGPCRSGYAAA
jgi:uncharacterized protein (UPF0303 family)